MFSLPLIRHEKIWHRRPRPAPDRRRLSGHPWVSSLLPASLLGSLALATLGVLGGGAAQAAEFSGICPVLGSSQPSYPSPWTPQVPPGPIALPQTPVTVNVGGKDYPICAVYMSISQSGQPVPPEIIPDPNIDLLFPDLTKQLWFDKGTDVANDFANALIENGAWSIGADDFVFSNASNTTNDQNLSDGVGLQVNPKVAGNKNDSNPVPFFLWKNPATVAEGKARQVFVKQAGEKYIWDSQNADNLDKDTKYWFWVLDAPGDAVPGPLPLLGAGAAYGWSRRLRQRIRQNG